MATAGLFSMLGGGDEAAMQRQLDAQKAQAFAQQTQEQRLAGMGYSAGAGLGRGIAGAFGADVTDPMVRQATQLRQLASQFDTSSSEGMAKFAQAARGINLDLANQAAQQALAMRKTEAEITAKTAEKKSFSVGDKAFLALAAKATPASVKAAQLADNDISLLEVPEAVKVSTYGQVLKDAGLKEGTPEFQKQMQAFAAAELEGTRKGKGTVVDVNLAGRKEFTEKLAGIDAKQVENAMATRTNALATVRSLDQLAALDDQGLISGSFATGRVGATNLLNTLGLASPADQQRLASSQNYQKVAGDVILGVLGGKLGAGFSNEDRKFIESLVPQLETSPMARRQLITFMRRKNMDIADEATRLENYARDKETLKGFTPKFPVSSNAPATALSADELAKAAGGKIVNGKFVPNK